MTTTAVYHNTALNAMQTTYKKKKNILAILKMGCDADG